MPEKAPISVKTIDGLFKALAVLSRTVDQILQRRAVEEALGDSLSPSKVQALRLLARRGGQTSSQIARFLGVSRPSVSQITDALERAGLIDRFAGRQDGRESLLKLTDKGRAAFHAFRRQQRHLLRNAVRLTGSGKAEDWTKTLLEISRALAGADQAFEHYCLQCGAHSDGSCVLIGGDADCLFLQHRSSTQPIAKRKATKR